MVIGAGNEFGSAHHVVDLGAHAGKGIDQPHAFGIDIVGNRVFHHHARLVKHRHTAGEAIDQLQAIQSGWPAVGGAHAGGLGIINQPGAVDQFGKHHAHGLQRFDFHLGIIARFAVLHGQHADGGFAAQDRHAAETVEIIFAGFRAIGEIGMGLGLGQRQRFAAGGDIADQALTHRQPGDVHGRLRQALRGKQFQHAIAQQVDGGDLAAQFGRHQLHHLVKLHLRRRLAGHHIVKAAQYLAGGVDLGHQAAASLTVRRDRAASASVVSSAMISATGCTLVTIPTDWPAIRLPPSTSPSTTARRRAPAQ